MKKLDKGQDSRRKAIVVQGVPKKLVRFAAKTTFFNTISLMALQTAQVFLGHSLLVEVPTM